MSKESRYNKWLNNENKKKSRDILILSFVAIVFLSKFLFALYIVLNTIEYKVNKELTSSIGGIWFAVAIGLWVILTEITLIMSFRMVSEEYLDWTSKICDVLNFLLSIAYTVVSVIIVSNSAIGTMKIEKYLQVAITQSAFVLVVINSQIDKIMRMGYLLGHCEKRVNSEGVVINAGVIFLNESVFYTAAYICSFGVPMALFKAGAIESEFRNQLYSFVCIVVVFIMIYKAVQKYTKKGGNERTYNYIKEC